MLDISPLLSIWPIDWSIEALKLTYRATYSDLERFLQVGKK